MTASATNSPCVAATMVENTSAAATAATVRPTTIPSSHWAVPALCMRSADQQHQRDPENRIHQQVERISDRRERRVGDIVEPQRPDEIAGAPQAERNGDERPCKAVLGSDDGSCRCHRDGDPLHRRVHVRGAEPYSELPPTSVSARRNSKAMPSPIAATAIVRTGWMACLRGMSVAPLDVRMRRAALIYGPISAETRKYSTPARQAGRGDSGQAVPAQPRTSFLYVIRCGRSASAPSCSWRKLS